MQTSDAFSPTRRTALVGLAGALGASALGARGAPRSEPHSATRLVVSPRLTYDKAVERYEATVPPLPAAELKKRLQTQPYGQVATYLAEQSPVSMFLFYTLDVSPFMTAAGHPAKCRTYLMGNPLIAEKMYGHDAGVMLYAPLRTAIHEDETGRVRFIIDRPSDLFASFHDSDITATGQELDATLVNLLKVMRFPIPAELRRV